MICAAISDPHGVCGGLAAGAAALPERYQAAFDGIYIIRAGRMSSTKFDTNALVETYKTLSGVERAFRALETSSLHVRPVFQREPPPTVAEFVRIPPSRHPQPAPSPTHQPTTRDGIHENSIPPPTPAPLTNPPHVAEFVRISPSRHP